MRSFDLEILSDAVESAFIEINYSLSADMQKALSNAMESEAEQTPSDIMAMINENLSVAKKENIPICQDTGMAVVFLEIGQDVHFCGGYLYDAVNEGVKRAYDKGFLRKSVVANPLVRINTGDNTPAIIHTDIVKGDKVKLTVTAKGFGSENTSRLFMLKPSDGVEGVKNAVLTAVKDAGANACPPMVVGVGIGGNFEKCALMAKHALTRNVDVRSSDADIKKLEEELLHSINESGIGPAGLGGRTTALAVNIESYPTHIAGLPVAVNICCHVNRHKTVVL